MQHVTQIDVVSPFDIDAGVVGLRQPNARADRRAHGGSTSTIYVGANCGPTGTGAHASPTDSGRTARDKRTGSEYIDGALLRGR